MRLLFTWKITAKALNLIWLTYHIMKRTERQKLSERLTELESRYKTLMRGRVMPSPKALRIKAEIQNIREEIIRQDRDAAERLALEKIPIDDVLQVIAIPLLADVMNDFIAGVDGMLRRNGVQETIFGIYTAQIRKSALAIVDTLSTAEESLPRLLDVDDTLVDAVKKKLMSFIKQRLKIKKR